MRSAEGFLDRFRGPVARSRDEVERGLKPEHQRAMEGASPVVVEGYSVEGLVAFGGQGAVYKAVQRGTGRLVAIKLPLGDTQRHPSTRYRFEREVELAARLDHPGIVRIIEACRVEDGRLGYVMEYVEGETIDRWSMRTRADGAAGMRRIVAVMAEVADAIAAAHQRAVLHRDIKPSNVIVAGDGKARVLDFGLAKSLDASGSSFVTMTGAFLGTLAYAAPEQIDGGAEAVDIRTDVYAMGLLLFLCLTGRLPYATDVPTAELLRQIRECDPVRPSTVVNQIPADLDAIVLKALAKVRERRYTTAGEFRDDLRAWLAGQAVRARFDSRWYVARKTIRRHRRVVAAGLVMGLLVAAGVGLVAYTIASTDAARAREAYERSRATTESARADAVRQLIDELLPIASIEAGNPLTAASVQSLNLLDRKLESGQLRDQPMLEAALRGLLAALYNDRGTLGRAELHARHSLRLHQITMGEAHTETLRAADTLAGILLQRRKLGEAELLAQRAYQSRSRVLPASHHDVLTSLYTLARIELERGRFRSAQSLVNKIESDGSASVEAHPTLTSSLIAINTDIALAEGRVTDALPLAQRAAIASFRLRSDDHPEVARAIRRLARAERAVGQDELAKRNEMLAELMEGTLGSNRPAETWAMLVELKERLLGPDDIQVSGTLILQGLAQQAAREWSEALVTLDRAVEILQREEGPDSLTAIDCINQFTQSMMREHRLDEIREHSQHRYEVYKQKHPNRLSIMIVVAHREWASWLGVMGRDEEAFAELDRVLVELQDIAHNDPIERIRAEIEIAELHAARGECDLAEPLARSILDAIGSDMQFWWEAHRAERVLVEGQITRREFALAEHTINEVARYRVPMGAGFVPEAQPERRMAGRWIAAYREVDRPEPPAFADLRLVYGLMDE
ncbi:MAG: serine/threonine protein kinase [Phycisphaeraceae bacterium]|nr:MAG: serine/threonine protein kinase [Phycisphaeraceae bacterium]